MLGFVYAAAILVISWNLPILDMHGFRQTQTALTVQWMAQGHPLLAYETPVLGYPWTIPFEFPLFQWVTLILHKFGVNLDNAGRIVSWLLFIAGLPLAGYTIRRLGGDRSLVLIFWSLWLFSPLYAFWSRAFMIESCATFLGLAFLAALASYLAAAQEQSSVARCTLPFALMTTAAVAGALVKITTFFAFALAGGALTGWTAWRIWQARQQVRAVLAIALGPGMAMGVSLAATVAWVAYSDALKARSLIGVYLTSTALHSWNFGSERILTSEMWSRVILGRAVLDTFGSPLPIALAAFAATGLPKARALFFAGILLYLTPFFVFTNLHFVHTYYQYANALFLIMAVASGVWAIGMMGGDTKAFSASACRRISIAVLVIIVFVDLVAFRVRFLPALRMTSQAEQTLALAHWVKRNVQPEDVVFAFGRDWSSELAYYSARRAVTLPASWTKAVIRSPPADLGAWTGGRPIGAVVDCAGPDYAGIRAWIRQIEKGRTASSVAGCAVYK